MSRRLQHIKVTDKIPGYLNSDRQVVQSLKNVSSSMNAPLLNLLLTLGAEPPAAWGEDCVWDKKINSLEPGRTIE